MLGGLVVILLCQLAGQVLVRATGLPVPGPVVGMLVFLVVLRVRRPSADAGTVRAAEGLLDHLGLFFLPAGVGVMVHLATLRAQWLPIGAGLVLSWLVALVVTGWVAMLLRRRAGGTRP